MENTVYIGAYADKKDRITPEGVIIMPDSRLLIFNEYLGISLSGIWEDRRITLVVEDVVDVSDVPVETNNDKALVAVEHGFWPVIIKLTESEAKNLIASLQNAIDHKDDDSQTHESVENEEP